MPRFIYKAKKGPRETTEGFVDAESEAQAVSKLSSMDLYPVSLSQEVLPADKSKSFSESFQKVKPSDIVVFTRQLADLLEAGLTLVNALDVIYNQATNKKLKIAVADIRDYVKSGNTFTQALNRYPRLFPPMYTGMVRSGETGGTLEMILTRLADFMESQEEFRARVSSAMAYPVLMAFVGMATAVVLLTFVMPRIVVVFEDLGQSLPLATSILLGISEFIRGYWYLVVCGLTGIVFAWKQMSRLSAGKAFLDSVKMRIPVVGMLIRNADITRFTNTLGTLLQGGISILDAMDIAKDVVSSEKGKADIKNAYTSVKEGGALSKALARGTYFPFIVTNMIAVGEESGGLEKSLLKIAQSYERRTDKIIKVVSSLLEPLMILFMGLVVGFIVISILLPIFQISFMAG